MSEFGFGFDPSDPLTYQREAPNPESTQFDGTDPGDVGRYLNSLASQVEDGPTPVKLTQDGVEEACYPDGEDDGEPEEHHNHPGYLAD